MFITLMYSPQLTFQFMNLRYNQYVEMLFGNLSTQKYNYTYPELEVFSYSDDIIESIDILDLDIYCFNGEKKTIQRAIILLMSSLNLMSNLNNGFSIIHVNCRSLNANKFYL